MFAVNNKRIAKNTLLLYVRMLLLMLVSLYTSRILLQALGVEDYGIYNLVSGFITLFSIISNALINATQRYFNIALGQSNQKMFDDIFVMSINILFLISIIIILIAATLGFWFINTQLNISIERMNAANWVFIFSVLTFVINLFRTPYNAAIIAYEKMAFYAYISVVEAIIKLGVTYILIVYSNDKLILYSILYFLANLTVTILYKNYCNNKLKTCRYKFYWKRSLFKELFSFTSWSFLGQTGFILRSQGDSFLVNRFYSVAVNAAMGINYQLTGALNMFVTNFQTAFKPQLTKSYAANEMNEHFKLLQRSSKFSFFLLLVLAIPVVSNIDFILNLWLVEVPDYTSEFVILGLISGLIMALSIPFATSILATGKIKHYQISLIVINLIGLFISYLLLRTGTPPYTVSIVNIIVQSIILLIRLYFVKTMMFFDLREYGKEVLLPVAIVTFFLAAPLNLTINRFNSLLEVVLICIVYVVITLIVIYLIGLNRGEKQFTRILLTKFISKFKE